jgi:phosphatidylserine/phosphatidylglycerophosphate/cardiolipin synthase-like enzyme
MSYRVQVKKYTGEKKKLPNGSRIIGAIHHKCLIVDDELLVIGSYNYTWAAANINLEDLYVTLDIDALEAWKHLYQSLWEGK